MRVNYNRYPRIKLFGKLSYLDKLYRSLLSLRCKLCGTKCVVTFKMADDLNGER